MSQNEYLKKILEEQNLEETSQDFENLKASGEHVKQLIKSSFPNADIFMDFAGSYKKKTLIKDSYDLDVVVYVGCDETTVGATLEEIYKNVKKALEKEYKVDPRRSALRIRSKEDKDLSLDVVPGRYIDNLKSDIYIYQNDSQDCRMKTNLSFHLKHIGDSGVTEHIRLAKLWKLKFGVDLPTFVLELIVVEVLKDKKHLNLEDGFLTVMAALATGNRVPVKDPANPNGNNLNDYIYTDEVVKKLKAQADKTLSKKDNWTQVFRIEPKTVLTPDLASKMPEQKPYLK